MQNKKKLLKVIVSNLKKQGAKEIYLFGSYARNEETDKSDIDLLVKFKKRKTLLEIVQLERQLYEKSGVKIDLLTKKAISPLIKDRIEQDIKVIYR